MHRKLFVQGFLFLQIVGKVSQTLHSVSYLFVLFLEVSFLFLQQHSLWCAYLLFFHFVNKDLWIPCLSVTTHAASCPLIKSFKTFSLNSNVYKLLSFFHFINSSFFFLLQSSYKIFHDSFRNSITISFITGAFAKCNFILRFFRRNLIASIFMHLLSSFSFKCFVTFHTKNCRFWLLTVDSVTSISLSWWRIFFVKLYLNNLDCSDMIYNIFFITMTNYLKSNTYEKCLFLKETRNLYFCVTPKNQMLHKSASVFLK